MFHFPNLCRRFGNELYKAAFPVYRPLYAAFKAFNDRGERRILAQHLSEGAVVLDVGANIGVYSQFLVQCVGAKGTVHCFEPSPDNFARLRKAMAHSANARLNQLAVSDKTGESVLYVSDELNVDHRLYLPMGESRKTVTIICNALDDYLPPGTRVDLIKMDIQGYELHALRGADRVLADNPGIVLLLEFWPYGLRQAGVSEEDLVFFLSARGFSFFIQGADGLTRCDPPVLDASEHASYCNVFVKRG